MTCDRCGSDVLRHFAGSIEVLRHAVPPKDAHYPRLTPSQPPEQAAPPMPTSAASAVPVPGTRPAQPDVPGPDPMGTPA